MSNKSIVPITNETWQTIQSIAPVAQASRMFGVTEQQAAIVMLKGHELGLGLASAFEFIHVIDDKPSLSPKGALALIHNSGELENLEIADMEDPKTKAPSKCRVTMKRKNGFEYTVEFSMDDAQRAGVVKSGSGWEKYPANMLRWRAVGYCADVVFPDVTGGMYQPEELGAVVDQEGDPIISTPANIIDGVARDVPAKAVTQVDQPKSAKKEAVVTLETIIGAGFTPDKIMAANDGRIPANQKEYNEVWEKLNSEKES